MDEDRGIEYSLLPRGQRVEGEAFWKRERNLARLPSGARPTAFLPPTESSLHSSYRLLFLPPLCTLGRFSFVGSHPGVRLFRSQF